MKLVTTFLPDCRIRDDKFAFIQIDNSFRRPVSPEQQNPTVCKTEYESASDLAGSLLANSQIKVQRASSLWFFACTGQAQLPGLEFWAPAINSRRIEFGLVSVSSNFRRPRVSSRNLRNTTLK